MNDISDAYAKANQVMAHTRPSAPPALSPPVKPAKSRGVNAWPAAVIFLVVVCLGTAGWFVVGSKRAHAAAAAAPVPEVVAPKVPEPEPVIARSLEPVDPDPKLSEAFLAMTINALLPGTPARVSLNGKIYGIGDELLPGLKLHSIENRTVIAKDEAGAFYRRSF